MNKIFLLLGFLLLSTLNNLKAQTLDWKFQTNDYIFKYNLPSDRVVLIHGESDGKKVVRSNRIFPSITGLDNKTELFTIFLKLKQNLLLIKNQGHIIVKEL
jgi:hypothetical protein|tara:strand:- start:578 stop:880 length:303 start_codon:yes stop_codon:yes gene_type:complete